jgi:hypothetical protein
MTAPVQEVAAVVVNWEAVSAMGGAVSAVAAAVAAVAACATVRIMREAPKEERVARQHDQERSQFEGMILHPVHDQLRSFVESNRSELASGATKILGLCDGDAKISEVHSETKAVISNFNGSFLNLKGSLTTRMEALEDCKLVETVSGEINAMQDSVVAALERMSRRGETTPDFDAILNTASIKIMRGIRTYSKAKWPISH